MRFIIVSGQSGAGKSVALRTLEDLGYYTVDNLPARLLPALVEELKGNIDSPVDRAAAVLDVRSPLRGRAQVDTLVRRLGDMGAEVEVVFLHAERNVLLERFSETRRRHPLTEGDVSLAEALEREDAQLEPLRQGATVHIDTTRLHLHQLRAEVRQRVVRDSGRGLTLQLRSFGFKYGPPRNADTVFDVRCLPNPYWERRLRELTGRDAEVQTFLTADPNVRQMCDDIAAYLTRWLPRFEAENRAYFSVAVGCTGGRHRSVFVVETLAERLRERWPHLIVRHQQLSDA